MSETKMPAQIYAFASQEIFMWLDEKFKHRRIGLGHEVCFVDGAKAATEETGTKAYVEVKDGPYVHRMIFSWPNDKADLETMEAMLNRVFEKGRQHGRQQAKAEIRDALGVKNPRP